MKKTIALFLVFIMSAFAFFGCIQESSENDDDSKVSSSNAPSESSDASEDDITSLLIGKWGGNDPEIIEKGGTDYRVTMVFSSDGTGSYYHAGLNLPFTWTASNGVLNMNMALKGSVSKPYSFKNKMLYIPDDGGRMTAFVKMS